MNTSTAAACILALLVLCAVVELLDIPTAVRLVLQLVLIVVAALIGSRIHSR